MEEKTKTKKERYWAFIMYKDSRPENWKQLLSEEMIKIAISPVHDRDMKEDGTIKKEHYHVLMCFNGPTTYERAEEIAKKVNATIPKRVLSVKGMYDYFTHKWDEDKAKYDENDIQVLNGFNINDYGMTTNEIEALKRQIIGIIREHHIVEYSKLYDLLYDEELYQLCNVVSTNTMFFNAYLKSRKYIDLYKEV